MQAHPKIVTAFLTAIVLSALYGPSRAAEPTGGLISHWTFDEGDGTTAYDSAGNNDGNVYGASWTDGLINGALGFDGSDYVLIGDKDSLDFGISQDFTITAWFKTSTPKAGMLVNKRPYERERGYDLYIDAGKVTARASGVTRAFSATTTEVFNNDYWHHVTAVYDRTDVITLYVDGHYRSSSESIAVTMDVNNIQPFAIGRRYGRVSPVYFNGSIDDVRVYERTLSGEEARRLYENGFASHGSLDRLEVNGPEEMLRDSSAQYKAIVYYEDGLAADVTALADWSVQPAELASIDEDGMLSTGCIGIPQEPRELTVFVEYTRGEVMVQAQMSVQILPPRTLHVPAEYGSIQAAIDDAVCDETIIVADGAYAGYGNRDIDFKGKRITVRSESGPENCIIDCWGNGRGFYFHNDEDGNSVLDGFTVKNGSASTGGGVFCKDASPTIRNCIITDNTADSYGGGIYCNDTTCLITNCAIEGNHSRRYGGGIYFYHGSPVIINSTVTGNSASRDGGGIYSYQTSTTITNCTIAGNTRGGGISRSGGSLKMANTIVWGNVPYAIRPTYTSPSIKYNDIEGGWSGNGNISADPRFVDSANGDYHLLANSPCVNAGDPCYSAAVDETDIDGEPRVAAGRVDMGADEFPGGPAMPVELEITGLDEVAEFSSVQYTATAHFEGGYIVDVTTDALWSVEPPNYADIDSTGLLETGRIEPAGHFAIYAQYSERGVTLNDEKDVSVSQLVDLEIAGPTDIRQNCPEQYNVIAYYANGHTADVTNSSLWEVDPDTYTVIDAGLLTIEKIEQVGDIFISAEHTSGGVTLEAEMTAQTIVPRTLYVPAAYQTIQEAIDVSECGDTIVVADGIYTGEGNRSIDFLGKGAVLKSENGPENCIIDCNGWSGRQPGAFYIVEQPAVTVDGFTITNCYNSYEEGVVIHSDNTDVTISNCIITGNSGSKSRGTIYFDGGNSVITNCVISDNYAGDGGGIYCRRASVFIDNCVITANYFRRRGGGVYCETSSLNIANSTISENAPPDLHHASGGGIYAGDSTVAITNCSILGNSVGDEGGGIYYCSRNDEDSLTITNSIITGNSAVSEEGTGGGIYFSTRYTMFDPLIVTNSVITANFAGRYCGGIYCYGPATISHCTIADNTAQYNSGGIYSSDPTEITNSILWANSPQQIGHGDSEPTVIYSAIQGGWEGEGNIDADPCFVMAGHWDVNDTWVDGDYHLIPASPCIDTGDPNYVPEPNETDLDGKSRVIGGRIDMGAYEYIPPIVAQVRISPRSLNLQSKGRWVSCYIVLPEDYNVADIDANSILLEDEISPDRVVLYGRLAVAKFSRSAVQELLAELQTPGEVELLVSGQLTGGTIFEGTDTIKIKRPPMMRKSVKEAQTRRLRRNNKSIKVLKGE